MSITSTVRSRSLAAVAVLASSRSKTAWTIGSPIQRTPNSVAAIAHETFSRRGRSSARKKVTGKAATSTITTWRGSP